MFGNLHGDVGSLGPRRHQNQNIHPFLYFIFPLVHKVNHVILSGEVGPEPERPIRERKKQAWRTTFEPLSVKARRIAAEKAGLDEERTLRH